MTQNVVRSLVTPDGLISAHLDRSVQFRPHRGKQRRILLPYQVTVMLACTGPQDNAFRLVVGDRAGSVHLLSLPELKLVKSTELSKSPISALEIHRPNGGWRLIAGCENGELHALGKGIPGGNLLLFNISSPINLIRSTDEILTIHSGWSREVRHWNGDHVAPLKRLFEPPTPPSRRQSRQLTLAKAAQA